MLSSRNQRRLRTYTRRLTATFGGELKHNCFFMHIPKCGGTSITEALYAAVPLNCRVGMIDANATRRAVSILESDVDTSLRYHDDLETGAKVYATRTALLLTHMAWNTHLIYGHVPFNYKAYQHFGDTYKFVTLMREPLSRTLSNFAHSAREGLIPNDFDAYLEGQVVRTHGLSHLRFFSGRHLIQPEEEAEAFCEAKENLALFSLVGFLDDLDTFSDKFKGIFGRSLSIFQYNTATDTKFKPTQAQMARLEKILSTEIEFWNYAKSTGR